MRGDEIRPDAPCLAWSHVRPRTFPGLSPSWAQTTAPPPSPNMLALALRQPTLNQHLEKQPRRTQPPQNLLKPVGEERPHPGSRCGGGLCPPAGVGLPYSTPPPPRATARLSRPGWVDPEEGMEDMGQGWRHLAQCRRYAAWDHHLRAMARAAPPPPGVGAPPALPRPPLPPSAAPRCKAEIYKWPQVPEEPSSGAAFMEPH